MADERRRITSDSFNPAVLELVQFWALTNSQNEGEFVRNLVQHHTYQAEKNNEIDSALEKLGEYCKMDLTELKHWIKMKRTEGLSNSQILAAIDELAKEKK